MANVVVEVHGQGGSGGSGNIPPQTPSNNPPIPPSNNNPFNPTGSGSNTMPSNDRLVEDIRREIQQRGAMLVPGTTNFTTLINQIRQQQSQNISTGITDKYSDIRKKIGLRKDEELTGMRTEISDKREQELLGVTDPSFRKSIERKWERQEHIEEKKINRRFDHQIDKANEDEAAERTKMTDELSRVMASLVDELKRGNPNSYLNNLRNQYKGAIWNRDNAETEGEAKEYSEEARKIQKQMQRAMGTGGGASGFLSNLNPMWGATMALGNGFDRLYSNYYDNRMSQYREISAAANGDAFGAMDQDLARKKQNALAIGSGAGGVIGGVVGGALAAAGTIGVGTGAGVGIGAAGGMAAGSWLGNMYYDLMYKDDENQLALGRMWNEQQQKMSQFTDLAMITRRGGDINSERTNLINQFISGDEIGNTEGYSNAGGITAHELGMTAAQLAQSAAQRIKQRGFFSSTDDVVYNALNQESLERVFNMNSGSLAQLSSYDRYGNNGNQDMANLVASLSARGTLGMSGGQILRSNEFMGYQQQLMELQKSWMNPNANFATRQLLTAQNAFGNNLDSRAITELGQMNNAITHPQEGYSKVMTYDVIQRLFPQTRGNLLAIRKMQYSNDPEVRAKIQRAMFNRLTQVYGGENTTSGYLALSQYTGIEDPDRLNAWVKQMRGGYAGVSKGSISEYTKQAKGYTTELSKQQLDIQDSTFKKIVDHGEQLNGLARTMLKTFTIKLDDMIKELKKVNN